MEFDEAHALFLSHHPFKTVDSITVRHCKKVFKDLLCHPKHGLAVYIIANQFILLKSRETDLEIFIEELVKHSHDEKSENRLNVTPELVDDLLKNNESSPLCYEIQKGNTRILYQFSYK
jgi:hypothetical protein